MTIPTLLADDLSPPQLSPGLPEAGALVVPASAAADLVHAALAYLGQIGRPPAAEQRWTAGDRRYLVGPLIVGDPAWGSATPAWLQAAVPSARLGLVLAGEHDQASEEEAVAYLIAASLAGPCRMTGPRSTSGSQPVSSPAGGRSRSTTSGPCSATPYRGARSGPTNWPT